MSTAPPGQGGDGKPRIDEALADRGTEATPPIAIPPSAPTPALTPPSAKAPPSLPQEIAPVKNASAPATAPAPTAIAQNTLTLDPIAPAKQSISNTPAASATGGPPGAPVPAADPAADTGLESDPFAKTPGVEFRNGKVEARSGRQVKPVRPRLTEASRRDLLSLQFPTILLKVRIDDTGKVQDVKVLRGSGSEAIDMPVYRAMWQWWFEPPKSKDGKPLPDVQLVAIHWG
jgi:TonB family protein